jgi:hypothetical protein
MRQLLLTLVWVLAMFSRTDFCRAADDPSELEQLKELGADVTAADGAVTGISVNDCSKFGDAEYRLIGRFHQQKKLSLGQCKGLTDKTLSNLMELTNLETFVTNGMQVTDKGLAQLSRLTNLRAVDFFHPSLGMRMFDGRGYAALKELPKLEALTIAGSSFNDKGMAAVGEITQLKHFRTWHTYQTQAGNQFLTKLTELKSLFLGQRLRRGDGRPNLVSLDDSTFDVLVQLKTLESLTLNEAKLALASLRRLSELPNLKKLELLQIDIPEEDIETLKTENPLVKIEYKPLTAAERASLTVALKRF